MNLHPLRLPPRVSRAAANEWLHAFDGANTERQVYLRYEELCYERGLDPYTRSKTANADVQQFLRYRRRSIVRFLNHTKLLEHTPPIRFIERKVAFAGSGFKLTVLSQVRADPTFGMFLTKLAMPYRFSKKRDTNRRYTLQLDPGTTFFAYNAMIAAPDRWFIGYDISCPMLPHIASAVPDENFVIHHLWLPIARSRRPLTKRAIYV